MPAFAPTIHATAVLIGATAVLIRGAPGSGKSELAYRLIAAAEAGGPFARLVADDRVHLAAAHGRLLASPPAILAGLIELRGVGILRVPHEALARVDLIVDLVDTAPERLPPDPLPTETILGVAVPVAAFRGGPGAPTFLGALRIPKQKV